MRLIDTKNLEEGMILAEDIIGKYDLVFLTRGTVLTGENIERIQKMNLGYIYVKDPDETIINSNSTNVFSKKEDQELNEQYSKCLASFKMLYEEASLGKKFESVAIYKSISPLIEDVMIDNNVLGRLRKLKAVDDYTYKHSVNVSILSTMMGKWLNFKKDDLNKLSVSAMLHDIGKSKINSKIINKPGKLSDEEFEEMKKHTIFGYEILQQQGKMSFDILYGVLQHHERMDGSGYPLKINKDKIHIFARIIAIADIFDAMTSQRVYKDKESPFKVAELIARNRFGLLDPHITNLFLMNISKFYVGNIVKLNTGEIGEIVLINKQMPTRPLVKVDDRFIDLQKSNEYEVMEVIV